MICLLEAGIDPCSLGISSECWQPCFGASVLHMEVSESTFCLQLHFGCYASGPLVQNNSPAKSVLDVVQSFNVVFSSEWSSDRFTGKPVSQTTGLYYYGARWYDPSIGRFISQDPVMGQVSDPQGMNTYAYVRNSPTVNTDPSGLYYLQSRQVLWSLEAYYLLSLTAIYGGWEILSDYWSFRTPVPPWTRPGDGPGPGGPSCLPLCPTPTEAPRILTNPGQTITNPTGLSDLFGPGRAGGSLGGIGWEEKLPTVLPKIGFTHLDPSPRGGNLANIYRWIAKAVRYAHNNPKVARLCAVGAVLGGGGLYVWELVESAKQGIDPPDPHGVFGVAEIGCLFGIGAALLVPT